MRKKTRTCDARRWEVKKMEGDKILLNKIARQLEIWAEESRVGGWSTHQVKPMQKLSKEIYEHLGRTSQQSNPADNVPQKCPVCGEVFSSLCFCKCTEKSSR
jgi:hypothetical protein